MNEEDYEELLQEESYERQGGEDTEFCMCGRRLNDGLCPECDRDEIERLIRDSAPEEIGSLAL